MSRQAIAEAYPSPRIATAAPWRIKAVSVLMPYRLAVTFNDGVTGIVDMADLIKGEAPGVFGALREPAFFAQVFLAYGALTWPNDADLAPEVMHEAIRQHGIWFADE
jgi:hypothetical protein